MDKFLTDQFKKIIAERTGLYLRTQDSEKLILTVNRRTEVLKLSSAAEYYRQLSGDSYSQISEWQELILMLTTAETFFFRDKGQFRLLREHIFPQIIEKHRHDRTLRLWSAGCSTGEELYSLAILINESLPDWRRWNIFLLGTDINSSAIEKAKRGVYGDWSFRMVDPDIQKRYFKYKSGWVTDRRIREMATFRTGNLRLDRFPDPISQICDIDLILCRNVFIYFTSEAIAAVVEKFCATLADGGFLMTGHNELHGHSFNNLKTLSFQASTIYQRIHAKRTENRASFQEPVSAQPTKFELSDTTPPASPNNRFTPHVIGEIVPDDAADTENEIEALYLKARSYANSGNLSQAISCCREIMTMKDFDINACYLLAYIMQEKGKPEAAKKYLKRIIYFNPAYTAAYVELASLYESEHDFKRAKKMWSAALDILSQVSSDDLIAPYDQVRALTLTRHIQKELKKYI
ncbi:CheR family methyltransferase [Desulfococcaceae bacterium HSG7]|nr:CheR family methyltransferase [Desulfococcaceae bacterium HSG7]